MGKFPMEITRDNLLSLIKSGLQQHDLSISALERHADVPKDTVRDFLRGKTQILRADKLQKILRVLQPQEKLTVRYALGDNAELLPHSGDEVDFPPGIDKNSVEAVLITGNAMSPVLQEGWVVYYSTDSASPTGKTGWQVPYNNNSGSGSGPFSAFINKPCVIRLTDGSLMLRTLKSGADDKYTLAAYNTPDMRDVSISEAYRIVFIKTF